MTPRYVDSYLVRLERELGRRGLPHKRIVEEAREHLIDAVEDGRQRGLSSDEAEREALERFGAAETVAAHAMTGADRIMNRLATVFTTVWQRKWWILVPTVLAAVVTSALSHYFLPNRYRSESMILIESPTAVAGFLPPRSTGRPPAQFQQITQSILGRTHLERMIREFGVYDAEQARGPLGDLVLQMRKDINISVFTSNHAQDDSVSGFNVSFVASDPQVAMKVTERLMNLIVDENLRKNEVHAHATAEFIDSELGDMRRRLMAHEDTIAGLRRSAGDRRLSRADLLPYEVLQERYKALIVKSEEAKAAANLERRQIGERFVIIDQPRRADRPVGPSRLSVNMAGTFAGLGVGLLLVGVRRRPTDLVNPN